MLVAEGYDIGEAAYADPRNCDAAMFVASIADCPTKIVGVLCS